MYTFYSWLLSSFNALACSIIRVQSKQDNQVYKEMIGQVLWSQLPSDHKNIEKQQITLLIMRFMLPNFRIMYCSFRIYQHRKITHADPDHLFLAITQNWAVRLQGHICLPIKQLIFFKGKCIMFWRKTCKYWAHIGKILICNCVKYVSWIEWIEFEWCWCMFVCVFLCVNRHFA